MRHVRQEVRVRHHDEAPPCHPHRGEALQLQGLREAVHPEGKPQGKSEHTGMTVYLSNLKLKI